MQAYLNSIRIQMKIIFAPVPPQKKNSGSIGLKSKIVISIDLKAKISFSKYDFLN